jgi:hypothetical protein
MKRLTPLCAVLVLVAGCYKYEPLEIGQVVPQTLVRARLSVSEAEQIKNLIATEDRVVSGVVVEVRPDQLLVELPSTRAAGSTLQVLHQRVVISRAGIVELESKRLDKTKTMIVLGAGTAALGALLFATDVIDPGRGGQPPTDPAPELRIKLFRLRH